MINLKTGKQFPAVTKTMTRRSALKGLAAILAAILAAGVAPSLCGNTARGIGYRNLAGRLAMFSGGGGEPKPYDREVKWLIANNNSYVDTGFYLNTATDDFEIKFGSVVQQTTQYVLSTQFGSSILNVSYVRRSNLFQAQLSNNLGDKFTVTGNKYTQGTVLTCSKSGRYYEIDTNGKTADFDFNFSDFSLTLWKSNSSYGNSAFIASFKIWRNGVLVLDMIPVVKDNVGYLFDRCGSICPLTGTSLYANAGTGAFTWEEL